VGRTPEAQAEKIHRTFTRRVDHAVLFIRPVRVVAGVEQAGLLHRLADGCWPRPAAIGPHRAGDPVGSAVLSAVVDNIPFSPP